MHACYLDSIYLVLKLFYCACRSSHSCIYTLCPYNVVFCFFTVLLHDDMILAS